MSADRPDSPSTTDGRGSLVPVELRRLPWVRRLALDYADDFAALAPFFAGNPEDPDAWMVAVARTRQCDRPVGEIAAVLARQQQQRQAPASAVEAAASLADPRTVAVVTGQQAGLFGGPLFTLLKALTALKLAQRLTAEHGVPAVAVFWVDAEDHDWDEVRGSTVLDQALAAHTVALPPRGSPDASPVAAVVLDSSIEQALDELDRLLPPTEFHAAVVTDLREAYRVGRGMAEAFACWIERVLGSRGLVVFDASDATAKPLVSRVFARELSAPGATARLAAEAGASLVAQGYHAQVQGSEDGVALFHLNGGRRPIRRRGEGWLVGDEPGPDLVREAADRPAAFSPNVLLRPIVQDTLFPTVCYVAGPSELAYLGQLRGVYEHFGVPMPLVFPRATATLLDSAAHRFLAKFQVPFDTLQPQDDAALNALLERQLPAEVEAAFARATAAVAAEMGGVIAAVPAIDPTLEGAARSTLGRMEHDLQTLHHKMIQAAKKRDETLRRQFARTRALAFPEGHAQERAIGFVSFLNQYGPTLVDRLADALPLELGRHWLVVI